MTSGLGLDWYSVYKLNLQKFDLQFFNSIVSNCQIGYGVDNVSHQYRKKILILFQNASKIIKKQMPQLNAQCSQLSIRKTIIAQNLARKQHDLQASFQQINNLKLIYAQKKRMLGKIKEKIAKKKIKKQKRIYFCSFCEREDFQNLQALKQHISTSHNKNMQNRSETSNQVNQIKDLLMTMKDKQIQMMSMFIKASRQMQITKVEKDYQNQYKRAMQISGTKTEQSKEQDLEELKGSSKFIYFKKSDQMKQQIQREQEFKRSLQKQKGQKNSKFHNQYQNQQNYYNIFRDIEENVSAHVEEVKNHQKKPEESNEAKSATYYDSNQFLSRFLKNQSISKDSRFSLVQNTPKPLIQFKQAKMTEKQSVFVAPSISDRLRELNKRKDIKNQTMFSTKRKFYEDSGYIFNSGPLVDDKGGDSDYQDYFGKNAGNNEIEDQQIKFHPISSHKSYYPGSKQSFHLSKLLSPKQSNSFIDKSQKQKSSVIVDLSDSFSRRDFQISKDDDTINLSDLKLSKLEKKRQQQRIRKLKQVDDKKSIVSDSIAQNRSQSYNKQVHSGSDHSKVSKVSKQSIKPEIKQQKGIQILKDFERKKVIPLIQQNYKFEQQDVINKYIKKDQRINFIGSNDQIIKIRFDQPGNIGILGQFLKTQGRISPSKNQNFQRQELKNFLKK